MSTPSLPPGTEPPSQPSLLPDDLPEPAALAAAATLPGSDGHYDELHGRLNAPGAQRGQLAPLWREFFDASGTQGWQDLPARMQRVQRRVQEDGATYNVYTEPGETVRETVRGWPLELLPVILGADEWAGIEAGVAQRARLLNAALADVYGERRLLDEGLLPPSLVLGHPQYLRPMHGVKPRGGIHLHIAAFELTRGPDGGWWVLGQRTHAPSGDPTPKATGDVPAAKPSKRKSPAGSRKGKGDKS